MHSLDLPAGVPVKLTVTATPDGDLCRWDVQVLASGRAVLCYWSQIGGSDLDQRIEIPAQIQDCLVEIRCRGATDDGWTDDLVHTSGEDTPNNLQVAFHSAPHTSVRAEGVLLNFAFGRSHKPTTENTHGQGPEAIEPRTAQTQAAEAR